MTDSVSSLLNQIEDQLKFIDLEQDDPIKGAQLSINVLDLFTDSKPYTYKIKLSYSI